MTSLQGPAGSGADGEPTAGAGSAGAGESLPLGEELLGPATLNAQEGEPLYAQIEARLRQLVRRRVLKPGDRLPTEKALQDYFGVSRVTVRQAFSNLARDGLVRRRRGKGTEVSPPRIEVPIGAESSFTEAMKERGLRLRSQLLTDDLGVAPEEVDHWLGAEGRPVWHLERLRIVQEEPIVHFHHYLPARLRPEDGAGFGDSLYRYLEGRGSRPSRHRESIEAVRCDSLLAGRLDIPAGSPLLRRIRVGSTAGGEVVEVSVGHYRGDRYRYVFDLGDRK